MKYAHDSFIYFIFLFFLYFVKLEMPNEKVKVFSETPSVQNKYGMDNEIKTEKRKLFFSMFKRYHFVY